MVVCTSHLCVTEIAKIRRDCPDNAEIAEEAILCPSSLSLEDVLDHAARHCVRNFCQSSLLSTGETPAQCSKIALCLLQVLCARYWDRVLTNAPVDCYLQSNTEKDSFSVVSKKNCLSTAFLFLCCLHGVLETKLCFMPKQFVEEQYDAWQKNKARACMQGKLRAYRQQHIRESIPVPFNGMMGSEAGQLEHLCMVSCDCPMLKGPRPHSATRQALIQNDLPHQRRTKNWRDKGKETGVDLRYCLATTFSYLLHDC